jgi:hypothetical protein
MISVSENLLVVSNDNDHSFLWNTVGPTPLICPSA